DEMRRKTKNDRKEKIYKQPPTIKKQKATLRRPAASCPRKNFVLFHKGGAKTSKVPHPLITKRKQLHEQMKTLAVEFGFILSARVKVVISNIKQGAESTVEKGFDV
ncbi:hypothetical protein P4283_28885, partial [Bacillus thuringiensis]|nr:hypothetical protein [Bacillus thuringiensis]